jgi:hypothetical protein
MTVKTIGPSTIALEGACPIEDAEALLLALLETPGATVDWTACDSAHAAVVQLLMTSGVAVTGAPRGEFLRAMVADALRRYDRFAIARG